MKKFYLGTLLLLGMLTAMSIVYGVLWILCNFFFPIDYWTLSGCLSTIGLGALVVWGLKD